jgi:hypothetical protein
MQPDLPELSGHELLAEWRKLMDAAASQVSAVGDRLDSPRQLLDAMRRQLELVQELIARERRLQQQLASELLAPVDAVFGLLEATGQTLRKQADALESAGRALEESASLVKAQAELFERTIGALRVPSDRAKAVVGIRPTARKNARRRPARSA